LVATFHAVAQNSSGKRKQPLAAFQQKKNHAIPGNVPTNGKKKIKIQKLLLNLKPFGVQKLLS
jgi:hypothetical protein